MRAHYLQHVPFEGLGSISAWLAARGAEVTGTHLYEDPDLPAVGDLDWLIVMGGPMGANDDHRHPWLAPERELIAEAVEAGRVVLGICLGAQLLAKALGAEVFRGPEPEIGWFRVEPVAGAPAESPMALAVEAFHWHSDTFELPRGAEHLARSPACAHQAFRVGERVLGLQFHLEMTRAGAQDLIEHCRGELVPARWVQTEREILGDPARFERANGTMGEVLDWLARATP